ncbi:hypothetical protein [Melittangium boletus]|uniref:hypothetical protein n=1 Tax=Melittangium boletus TaxID=83453 RepID=UPI003DA3B16C
MAVRTDIVGIKNRRQVDASAAQPNQQASKGCLMPFHDEIPLLRRDRLLARATLGPAAELAQHKAPRGESTVRGRKKPPSEMHIRRVGG